jgi:hypothetical protein
MFPWKATCDHEGVAGGLFSGGGRVVDVADDDDADGYGTEVTLFVLYPPMSMSEPRARNCAFSTGGRREVNEYKVYGGAALTPRSLSRTEASEGVN